MIRVDRDVIYNSDCALDVIYPEKKYQKVLLYIHGGGLVNGDKSEKNTQEIGQMLAKRGICFVTINYRLLSEASYPRCLEDAAQALAYTKQRIATDCEFYVWGQSGGGHIAMMLALCGKYLTSAGINVSDVGGWFIESAQPTTHFSVLKYRGEDERLTRIDESAPLYYIGSVSVPKMHLIVYDNDMSCRYEQNMLFYKSALEFEPQAPLTIKTLQGTHCQASFEENGEYRIFNELTAFLGC